MWQATLDPTAGETARAVAQHLAATYPVQDPTSPLCGQVASDSGVRETATYGIVDPTSPACGQERV
jgi:hypothetical protein